MSHKGTSTFITQRASAVILLPLAVWFLWSIVSLAGADYAATRAWAGEPVNAVLVAGFIIVAAFHMRIGLGEVIEDYIHSGLKGVFDTLNLLAALAVAAGAAWAAYTLAFAG